MSKEASTPKSEKVSCSNPGVKTPYCGPVQSRDMKTKQAYEVLSRGHVQGEVTKERRATTLKAPKLPPMQQERHTRNTPRSNKRG